MSESQDRHQRAHSPGDIWVIIESGADGVRDGTFEALQEGSALSQGLGSRLVAVLIGEQTQSDVHLLQGRNISQTYCLEHPLLSQYSTNTWVAALANLALERRPRAILLSSTPTGLDLAPRLAARLKTAVVNDCVIVRAASQGEIECVVPTHQEKVYTTYNCSTAPQPLVATLRRGAIGVEPPTGQDHPTITIIHPRVDSVLPRVQTIEHIPGDPRKMDLRQTERIIAGGRGMVDAAGWALIQDTAGALDASPAGSRKALDMGLLPRDRLIGLSGKSVAPKYYIAAGISGDHYHLQAVQTKHLIAINTDPKAPVFKQSTLGILGSMHEILPILAAKLRSRLGQENK